MEGLMLTSHIMRLMIHRWLKEMGLYIIYLKNRQDTVERYGWERFTYPMDDKYYKSIDNFLISSFSWSLTPQKDAFWRRYHVALRSTCDNNPFLKKLLTDYKIRFKYT